MQNLLPNQTNAMNAATNNVRINFHENGETGDCEITTSIQNAERWINSIATKFGIKKGQVQTTKNEAAQTAIIKFKADAFDLTAFQEDIDLAILLDSLNLEL